MIELKSAIISSNEGASGKANFVLDKGLNTIEYAKKYLFDFFHCNISRWTKGSFLLAESVTFQETITMND